MIIFSTNHLFESCFCVCVRLLVTLMPVGSLSYGFMYYFWGRCIFFQQSITVFDKFLVCSLSYEKSGCFCFMKYLLKFLFQIKYVDKPYSTFIRILTLAIWGSFEFKVFTHTLLEMLKFLEFMLLNRLHKLPWTHWLPIQED